MTALSVIVVVMVLLTRCHTEQTNNNVNVTISLGTVTGLHVVTYNIEYYSFRGIPYANATTRFKAPTPMKPWTSVVMATNDGPQCAQPNLPGRPIESPVEECLFLNVYTPQLPQAKNPDQPKLPVMVFIHGGAFFYGSSTSHMYGPEFFMADKNVVLVSFNYRLGIFGFLSIGTSDAQGNAGMKDQVEALRFVKNEISYFGGDPNSVTIFGESSAAASVVYHVLSPMSKGLFHSAIAQSGSALADWTYIDASNARERATIVARNLECDTENTTTIVNCLSKMSTLALCQASTNVLTEQAKQALSAFMPVIETKVDEDVFLVDHPMNVLINLTEAVPLIIGTNKDDGALLLSDDDHYYAAIDRNLQYLVPREVIQRATTEQLNALGQQMRAFYFNNGTVSRTTLQGLVNLYTDKLFMYPTAQTVRKLAEKKSVVYLYHFAYSGGFKPPQPTITKLGFKGVSHAEDLGYLFYSSRFNNTNLMQTTTQDYQTMKRMIKLWTTFAITGAPNSSTIDVIKDIHWPQITNASELNYLEMETSFTAAKDYYKERIAFWDQLTKLQSSSAFKIKPTTLLSTLFSLFLVLKFFNFPL